MRLDPILVVLALLAAARPTPARAPLPQSIRSTAGSPVSEPLAPTARVEPRPEHPPERAPAVPWRAGLGPWSFDRAPRPHVDSPLTDVRLARGELIHQETDLVLPGRGLDLRWVRTYRSRPPAGNGSEQGHGWTHGYDIRLEEENGGLDLRDGTGRADLFRAGPASSYVSDEHFLSGQRNPDGSYTFTFPDRSSWRFHPLDGSPAEGRIDTIADRAGNVLGFQYDANGRLTTVVDTLMRPLFVAYDGAGRISSVTDATGRQVTYAYYGSGDADGGDGDLRSVTSPPIVGTSTGNDFPSGKTTTYTYSKGFADEPRNHDLLTITNGAGETWLQNVYSPAVSPDSLEYDRVISQASGTAVRTCTYQLARAGGGALHTVVHTNDGRGVVRVFRYDDRNRLVEKRELTGFSTPGAFVTDDENRPTGKLRPGDPDAFVTTYAYDRHSMLVRRVRPAGDEVRFVLEEELNPGAPILSAGNLRELRRLPGPRGGAQPELVSSFEYSPPHNRPVRAEDPQGNVTTHGYDSEGNRVWTQTADPAVRHDWTYDSHGRWTAHVWPADATGHRRRDERTYDPATGLEDSLTRDAGPGGLATVESATRDAQGNPTSLTDASGHTTLLEWNAARQLVRVTSEALSAAAGARYRTDYLYDAADRLVGVEELDVDETGAIGPNTHWSTSYGRGSRGELTTITREVDEATSGTVELERDAELLVTRYLTDAARSGAVPDAVLVIVRDERGLPFRSVRAPGAPSIRSTCEWDYDANGNTVRFRSGLEAGARERSIEYDGYDRVVAVIDPMGNRVELAHDGNGDVVVRSLEGELTDLAGDASNTLLERTTYSYDALRRVARADVDHFDTATGTPIAGGVSTWLYAWDGLGGLTARTSPVGSTWTHEFDRLHRLVRSVDPAGNEVVRTLDAAGNVTTLTRTHRSDVGSPDETYLSTFAYDELDRLVQAVDPAGATTSYDLDSRGLARRVVDARGNVTVRRFDGLRRTTELREELRDGGMGAGVLLGERVTLFGHVFDFGLECVTDDGSNTVAVLRDALGRPVRIDRPDGTAQMQTWNAHDELTALTDANGSSFTFGHDGLGRIVSTSVVPGPGVSSDTLASSFAWDGRGLLASAADEDTSVSWTTSSLGAVLSEIQTVQTGSGPLVSAFAAASDASGLPTGKITPGGRTLSVVRDALGRESSVTDGAGVGYALRWIGPDRVDRVELWNGTTESCGRDAAGRKDSTTVTGPGSTTLLERTAAWTATGEVAGRAATVPAGSTFAFSVDSLGRLVGTVETPAVGPAAAMDLQLDDVGNRMLVTGGPSAGAYTMDPTLPAPGDAQANQYTTTPFDERTYDARGALLSRDPYGPPPPDTFEYDAHGRMVARTDGATGVLHRYAHDALGRRLLEARGSTERVLCVASDVAPSAAWGRPEGLGWSIGPAAVPAGPILGAGARATSSLVEERDPGGATLRSYLREDGLRSPSPDSHGGASPSRRGTLHVATTASGHHGVHADPVGNVAGLSDPSGSLVERYEFGPFGAPRIFDGLGQALTSSAVGNPHTYGSMQMLGDGLFYDEHAGATYASDVGRICGTGPPLRQRVGTDLGLLKELERLSTGGAGLEPLEHYELWLDPLAGLQQLEQLEGSTQASVERYTSLLFGAGLEGDDPGGLAEAILSTETAGALDNEGASFVKWLFGKFTPWGDYDRDGTPNYLDGDDDNDGVSDTDDKGPRNINKGAKEKGEDDDESIFPENEPWLLGAGDAVEIHWSGRYDIVDRSPFELVPSIAPGALFVEATELALRMAESPKSMHAPTFVPWLAPFAW